MKRGVNPVEIETNKNRSAGVHEDLEINFCTKKIIQIKRTKKLLRLLTWPYSATSVPCAFLTKHSQLVFNNFILNCEFYLRQQMNDFMDILTEYKFVNMYDILCQVSV